MAAPRKSLWDQLTEEQKRQFANVRDDKNDPGRKDRVRKELERAYSDGAALTPEELAAMRAQFERDPNLMAALPQLTGAIAALVAGQGNPGDITAFLSEFIQDENTRKLVNGLLNAALMGAGGMTGFVEGMSAGQSAAFLLPIFDLIGLGGFFSEVAGLFAKLGTLDKFLHGDITSILDAFSLFGNLSPVQQEMVSQAKAIIAELDLLQPFTTKAVLIGPPGVYVNGVHIAYHTAPTQHMPSLIPGMGSLNVLFEGKGVWRANSDQNYCPMIQAGKDHGQGQVVAGSPDVTCNQLSVARDEDLILEGPLLNMVMIQKKLVAVNPDTGLPISITPIDPFSSGIPALDSLRNSLYSLQEDLLQGAYDLIDDTVGDALQFLWEDVLGQTTKGDPSISPSTQNCGPQGLGINQLIFMVGTMAGIPVNCTPHEIAYGAGGDQAAKNAADRGLDAYIRQQAEQRGLSVGLLRLLMYPGYRLGGIFFFPKSGGTQGATSDR